MILSINTEGNVEGCMPQLRLYESPDSSSKVDPKWGTNEPDQIFRQVMESGSKAINLVGGLTFLTRPQVSGLSPQQYAQAMVAGVFPIRLEATKWHVAARLAKTGYQPAFVWIDNEDEATAEIATAYRAMFPKKKLTDLQVRLAWDRCGYESARSLMRAVGWNPDAVCVEGCSNVPIGYGHSDVVSLGIKGCTKSHVWATTPDEFTTKRLLRHLWVDGIAGPVVHMRPDTGTQIVRDRLRDCALSPANVIVLMYFEDWMVNEESFNISHPKWVTEFIDYSHTLDAAIAEWGGVN